MDTLKKIAGVILGLTVGLLIATYFNNPDNPSPLGAIVNSVKALKTSFMRALNPPPPTGTLPGQGPGDQQFLSASQTKEADEYFRAIAQSEEAKKKNDKDNKNPDSKDKNKKEALSDVDAPSFLFPVEKLEDSNTLKRGAVYNMGTAPYGPPPLVKTKLFKRENLLSLPADPSLSEEDASINSYTQAGSPLPSYTRTTLDSAPTFEVQEEDS